MLPEYAKEALINLQNAGLIYMHEEIIFASLAARRTDELDV